jgi:hypothetical protein
VLGTFMEIFFALVVGRILNSLLFSLDFENFNVSSFRIAQ